MKRVPVLLIAVPLTVYAVMAVVGVGWGLPTDRIDPLLFGAGPVWSGEMIARLTGSMGRFEGSRGADVDADPVVFAGEGPAELAATEADVAAIYRRYRLYSHQPDEMITLMALAGMRPRELRLDPKLYQYGGLFIYPVGAVIALSGRCGLIEVTSDLVYYLDHPDEFGKFYVAARLYVALWGGLGVLLVYAIASRLAREMGRDGLGRPWAGLVAALLFVCMPVVVCMSHEAKPHLPGAVLMLAAVWFAMGYVQAGRGRDWAGLCASCGAALGTVLSSLPVWVLIPVAEWLRPVGGLGTRRFWQRTTAGVALGLGVYLLTNPYVAINAVSDREVLRSNLSNSVAMYEVGRLGEGLMRVVELTVEGATVPVVVFGATGLALSMFRRRRETLLLAVPAGLVLVQFVLLGAGKPAEYGRFGVFPDAALAIGAGCLLTPAHRRWRGVAAAAFASALMLWAVGYRGWGYLYNFHKDTGPDNTRERFHADLGRLVRPDPQDGRALVCVLADPAPYGLPPMNFAQTRVLRYPTLEAYLADPAGGLVIPVDQEPSTLFPPGGSLPLWNGVRPYSPISWANKPIAVYVPRGIEMEN